MDELELTVTPMETLPASVTMMPDNRETLIAAGNPDTGTVPWMEAVTAHGAPPWNEVIDEFELTVTAPIETLPDTGTVPWMETLFTHGEAPWKTVIVALAPR